MTSFKIIGGTPLRGAVRIGGAKNASFKLMIAAACGIGESKLLNMSNIGDVDVTYKTLEAIGVKCSRPGDNTVYIAGNGISTDTIPHFTGEKTRAATLFAGLLLNKKGKAIIPLPGGCALGDRPIERHLDGFRAMGATVLCTDLGIEMEAKNGLHGATYRFEKKSHTGTEALIIAAVLALGQTIIENAGQEPEIDDLISFFNQMGAQVKRVGENIVADGVKSLHGATHYVMSDRNEAVSYATMAIATRGDVIIEGAKSEHLQAFLHELNKIGGLYEESQYGIRFWYDKPLVSTDITTSPEPGFMTDWQPLWTTMMTQASGVSTVVEAVTQHRLAFTNQLVEMGAKIEYFDPNPKNPAYFYEFNYPEKVSYPHAARITGPTPLLGKHLTVPDLRGGATLVMAAILAKGESVIDNIELIDRGYENFDERLRNLSANIERT
ncbi:MAG: UDP-N-acetylglucosamine 1-carboxyvinyltransferase [Microgenomates group bacterium]